MKKNYEKKLFFYFTILIGFILFTSIAYLQEKKETKQSDVSSKVKAIQEGAKAKLKYLAILNKEVSAFLNKLVTDEKFAEKFQAALEKNDTKTIRKLLNEGGIPDEHIDDMQPPLGCVWFKVDNVRWLVCNFGEY
jgi:hypothetical protein